MELVLGSFVPGQIVTEKLCYLNDLCAYNINEAIQRQVRRIVSREQWLIEVLCFASNNTNITRRRGRFVVLL